MIYVITRHPGAWEWLQQQIVCPSVHLEHLADVDVIRNGDIVIGTLPINLIEAVCRRGGRYLHLEIRIPQSLRGQELSALQLTELGASLVEYVACQPRNDDSVLSKIFYREREL